MREPRSPIPLVDLNAQHTSIRGEIDGAIWKVIEHGRFVGGEPVLGFEKEFASWLGVRHCIGCGNGTDALELLLRALDIGPGDEVLVPANSWISTSEAVTATGAMPVFVDVHPRFHTLDVDRLTSRLTPATRAIIPVHLYGLPAEMDSVLAFAQQHGLRVIEDAAQAHGARYRGQLVGTFGDGAVFSFYPGKNLGALGDAGAIVTNLDEVASRTRRFANHGQLGKHDHAFEGRNSRLDAIQAAVLSVKLRYLEEWNHARRTNAGIYRSLLRDCDVRVPRIPPHAEHVFHVYAIQSERRDELRDQLAAEGITAGIHYPTPLPLLPAYAHLGQREEDYPVAVKQSRETLSLPMYPELKEEQIARIAAVLRKRA